MSRSDFKIIVSYGEELLLSKSVVQVWREKGSEWETKVKDLLKTHNRVYANDDGSRLWDPSMDIENAGQKRSLDGGNVCVYVDNTRDMCTSLPPRMSPLAPAR